MVVHIHIHKILVQAIGHHPQHAILASRHQHASHLHRQFAHKVANRMAGKGKKGVEALAGAAISAVSGVSAGSEESLAEDIPTLRSTGLFDESSEVYVMTAAGVGSTVMMLNVNNPDHFVGDESDAAMKASQCNLEELQAWLSDATM
jgi:hypothetical protein